MPALIGIAKKKLLRVQGPPAAGVVSPSFTLVDSWNGTDASTNTSPVTIGTARNFGPTHANRRMVLGLSCVVGAAVTGINIGGSAATVVQNQRNASTSLVALIAQINMPAGANGNIQIVTSNFQVGYYVAWLFSMITSTPTASSSGNDPFGTDTADLAQTVPSGGIGLWLATGRFHASGISLTGTNIAEVAGSPAYVDIASAQVYSACATGSVAGATTGTLNGGATDDQGMVGATWGLAA